MSEKALYNESSIQVLKGLEPVRQRPGMYTRTESPLHIITEVIDNASDEAIAGYCKNIQVTLHTDGSVSVEDDGRGIPVGRHPEEKIPTIEVIFTRLHSGGKFQKGMENAYTFSGGLHGVGVSVTNALSTRVEVNVCRDKKMHEITFTEGEVTEKLKSRPLARGEKKSGTKVTVWPDAKYFDSPAIPLTELRHLLRSKAILLPGATVSLLNEKTGETETWRYENGFRSYLSEQLGLEMDEDTVIPLFEGEHYAANAQEGFAVGEGAAWIVAWTAEGPLVRESYVNLIPTSAGGTHESGLRDGLFNAVKSFAEMHSLLPKGIRLLPEDVFARVSFLLSARVLDPQFQGQIKERLNSRDAVRLVSHFVRPPLELWLNQNVDQGRKLADLVIRQAQSRLRSAQKVEKKKSSGVAVLPGKLTDCESTDITRNELFLVEGDSAGGSAKMGRNKEFQAILPLRGKVLNSWETERNRLFANQEIHDISVAIGVDPHDVNDNPDLSGLRYGKICILSDADVDGSHIQVLLLTLFFRHFPKLIENGNICVARPPLYRVDVPARGKRPVQKLYALDETELFAIRDKLRKDEVKDSALAISRFKGLGEMNAEQLWETTLNPDTRRLLPVTLGDMGQQHSEARFQMLMGKGEAAARRAWMEEHGHEAQADI
ncbi:type IIA DNA topoisomerase subunit B [Oxalobacter vibrioformis]|uniref:DNA topoisomerase 4 subunit B n=1 Tax=Oxalobacter vibrioformis TaxID=933080 RepID=A0A9E9M0N6_9BURK|nr:DNA topoisomerase IV subunit B [Oxalobacter vibrioformis]WAW10683.1 type IIA DNA topoisomerase subunit B [Oxalobacter vibrioformis]